MLVGQLLVSDCSNLYRREWKIFAIQAEDHSLQLDLGRAQASKRNAVELSPMDAAKALQIYLQVVQKHLSKQLCLFQATCLIAS